VSRSGYSDDWNGWASIRYRGAVASAIRGKRGQAMLIELAAALDAMPVKRLARNEFVRDDGCMCALGVLGTARGLDMSRLKPKASAKVAELFGISEALANEIMFENDTEPYYVAADDADKADERRWHAMREWVGEKICPTT